MNIGEVAFFGGTFDPPHIGHKKIIEFCKNKSIKVNLNQKKLIKFNFPIISFIYS